jgi:hypothetical protein
MEYRICAKVQIDFALNISTTMQTYTDFSSMSYLGFCHHYKIVQLENNEFMGKILVDMHDQWFHFLDTDLR